MVKGDIVRLRANQEIVGMVTGFSLGRAGDTRTSVLITSGCSSLPSGTRYSFLLDQLEPADEPKQEHPDVCPVCNRAFDAPCGSSVAPEVP